MMQGSPKSVAAFEASNMDKALNLDDLPRIHLFPSLLSMNWEMVQSRCKKYQTEASQWVSKRQSNQELKWRRLPIHQACICNPSTTIITSLLDAYPKGVCETDHQKRLPIHLACIHGASTYVIYILLTAFPDSVNEKDEWGKHPADYVASSTNENKAEVENLFHKGANAYEFGTSERVKVKELKNSFERRLVEASSGDFVEQISPTDDVELELEDVVEDLPAEVLMSRSIIRGLEEQLEAALNANNDSRARADTLEIKVKALEKEIQEKLNDDKVAELERELSVVSARNSNMNYAFEKLEKAVLTLETSTRNKEKKLNESNAKVMSLEVEREDKRNKISELEEELRAIPGLMETMSELKERNFELEEIFYTSKIEKADLLIRLEKENETSIKLKDINNELENRITKLAYSASSAEEEKSELISKQMEQLESLENEKKKVKATFISTCTKYESLLRNNEELGTENKDLSKRLENYEEYHEDAEKRMDFLEAENISLRKKNGQFSRIISHFRETYEKEHIRYMKISQLLEEEGLDNDHDGSIENDNSNI